jgi:hypothetical protein
MGRLLSNPVIAFAMAVSVAFSGALLLITPTIRLVENVESGPLNERHEHSSPAVRLCIHRRPFDVRHAKIVNCSTPSVRLAHSHHADAYVLSGHRLFNGLLAPMTC